jgi:hypothetical protein
MKFRNPFYLTFALLVAAFVATANHRGWSVMQSLAARTWQHSSPNTQHK